MDDMPGSDPFTPPDVDWKRVSPKLIVVRLVGSAIGFAITGAIFGAIAWFVDSTWLWVLFGAWAVFALISLLLIPRRVRSWGYAERADDLLIRHGLLFKVLVVVPYGRMQYVDVNAGPIDRALGLATVQLHTASASSDASIPGLPQAEAARLRDQLAARGEARLAGL